MPQSFQGLTVTTTGLHVGVANSPAFAVKHNQLIAVQFFVGDPGEPVPVITDNLGNTYTTCRTLPSTFVGLALNNPFGAGAIAVSWYYAIANADGSCTVTATWSGGGTIFAKLYVGRYQSFNGVVPTLGNPGLTTVSGASATVYGSGFDLGGFGLNQLVLVAVQNDASIPGSWIAPIKDRRGAVTLEWGERLSPTVPGADIFEQNVTGTAGNWVQYPVSFNGSWSEVSQSQQGCFVCVS